MLSDVVLLAAESSLIIHSSSLFPLAREGGNLVSVQHPFPTADSHAYHRVDARYCRVNGHLT